MRVTGTVQGVGFRPYVFRLASELGLGGWVLNDERGVLLEVEGEPAEVEAFARASGEPPPLAIVEGVISDEAPPTGETEFRIVASPAGGEAQALVAPDTATCEDCLAEIRDPEDRRYRYPFTNCTNCGPRFTIVRGVPYDRPLTTMAGFEMCDACRAEYEDPRDRRFHAQPNACPVCGPAARMVRADRIADRSDADRMRWPTRRRSSPRARSSRSRASAATTSPAWPTPTRRSPSCAPASVARTSRSR